MDQATIAIGKNIREIRFATGLNRADFSLLSDISQSTLNNIESGKHNFKMQSVNGILKFVGLDWEILTSRDFKPQRNLREKLILKYKNSADVSVLLAKRPTIPYAIKCQLIPSGFLSEAKEINEIRKYLLGHGWDYKGNSLHTTLSRMPDLICITPHPLKKNTNIYTSMCDDLHK